jgi:hypothetical protein
MDSVAYQIRESVAYMISTGITLWLARIKKIFILSYQDNVTVTRGTLHRYDIMFKQSIENINRSYMVI